MKTKILIIKTSPIHAKSSKSHVASLIFGQEYLKQNPDHEVDYYDLDNEKKLHTVLSSKNIARFFIEPVNQKLIDLINKYDKIVLSTSLINAYPSQIFQALFNRITIARKTFNMVVNPNTKVLESKGIFENKKMLVIITAGNKVDDDKIDSFTKQILSPCKFLGFQSHIWIISGTNTKEYNLVSELKQQENLIVKSKEYLKFF